MTDREILTAVVATLHYVLHDVRRREAMELALRRNRTIAPGELESAERYLAGVPGDELGRLQRWIDAVRDNLHGPTLNPGG